MIHAISTGKVKITKKWVEGEGEGLQRLANTFFDNQFSEWLPIWCFLIEAQDRLLLIDTGISQATCQRMYFPPHMPLIQRAAKFSLQPEEEIGFQIQALGYDLRDIETVILTHLHQDHDGGLHHFPNAKFLVSREEWKAAPGFVGRMNGYLNHLWPKFFDPQIIDFSDQSYAAFSQSYQITKDLTLVPTYGHSPGHMSLIYDQPEARYFFIGDTAYSEYALFKDITDGVTTDIELAKSSMGKLRSSFVKDKKNIILPSHDPDVSKRLD